MRHVIKKSQKETLNQELIDYTDLKMSDINDNKKFRKNVKPVFVNKIKGKKLYNLGRGK